MQVILKIGKSEIAVEGNYYKGRDSVWYPTDKSHDGDPSEYEITNIEVTKGSLIDLIDELDSYVYEESSKRRIVNLWEYLEELCLNKIENE